MKTARPEDVASIDAILKVFYDVISGPAGEPRDWDRDESLWLADSRRVAAKVENGSPSVRVMSHEQFVERSIPLLAPGFFEHEIHRVVHRFGNIAHVLSTYESRRTADGPVFTRGVNSINLYWDGSRWWIASAVWDSERPGEPLPKELLP